MTALPRPGRSPLFRGAAPVFDALGDPTRLRIVSDLCAQGPMSVTRLTFSAGVTRQAVSKHLRILEDAGLVRSARQGRTRICRLESARLERAQRELELICKRWDTTLSRLRKYVER